LAESFALHFSGRAAARLDEPPLPTWTLQEYGNLFQSDVHARSSLTFSNYDQAEVSLLILQKKVLI